MLDAAPSVGKAAAAAEGTAGAAAASAASTTTGDNEAERRKMLARQELEALTTAVEVFKVGVFMCVFDIVMDWIGLGLAGFGY